MASTYSPSLRIELIGAGEQAGTWNTTTNSNLGTIIESAIAGYVSVSVTSANQAFTALDGAPDQARNAVIALTTTTTANFAVYAPPQEKTYVIYNTTAYVATIYNSTVIGNTTAAGAGIEIPAGKTVTVYSNGTAFFSSMDHAVGSFSVGTSQTIGTSQTVGTSQTIGASQTVGGLQIVRGALGVTESISTNSSAYLNGASITTVAQASAINTTTDTITLATAAYSDDVAVALTSSTTMPTGLSTNTTYFVVDTSATSFFAGTGSISGTTLTITAVQAGSIGVGTAITGTGVTSTTVASLGTGTGQTGTYNVVASQTVASTTISGTYSGSQTIKLSTSVGGAAVNITAVGTGNMTITPVSLGITAPTGTTTSALATCEFVANSNLINATNWEFDETSATQTATITIASPAVVTVASSPTAQTAVAFTTTGALPTGLTVNTPYYVFNRTSTTYKLSTEKDESQSATITIDTPGLITVASAPANGDMVNFTTTGALPTGLSVGTFYFVVNRTSTTFEVAATAGGTAINTSGSQSGDQAVIWRTPVNTSGSQSGTQTENTSKLKLLYKNSAKMSIDLGGNMILTGSVTASDTP
jgi:hypothetical protein